MKQKYCCLILALMLLASTTTVLVSVEPQNVAKGQWLGKVHVDASAVLRELGCAEEDMASIPSKLMVQILRSYNVTSQLHEDGDYYVTITPDSPRAEVNLIGTDRVSPYIVDLPREHAEAVGAKSLGGDSTDYLYNQRACLVLAIWDYPGTGADLPQDTEDEYDAITSYISSASAYDYWHFMTNSECTYYYLYNWITWACAAYESVDIYWNGHGTEVNDLAAFVSYDAWSDSLGVITSNLYFAEDFDTGTYDYSTLRLGSASFCYG